MTPEESFVPKSLNFHMGLTLKSQPTVSSGFGFTCPFWYSSLLILLLCRNSKENGNIVGTQEFNAFLGQKQFASPTVKSTNIPAVLEIIFRVMKTI